MRKLVIVVLVLALLGAGGWFGYQRFIVAQTPQVPAYEVVNVARGTISAAVSATGTVLPERQANLSLQSAGTVQLVPAKVGDRVVAGQLLVQLDTVDLELALRQAQVSARTAQAQMRQLQEKPASVDVAAAQAALNSAQAAYQQLLNGADADQLAAARAAVEQAKAVVNQAQTAYDQIKSLPNAGMLPQALQLQQATINYETAQAQYRVTSRGATQAQLVAAQAQIAQAQSALDRLQRGVSTSQLDIAQAAVDQADLAVQSAKRRLDNARLVAPWDGVLIAVNVVEGALAQIGVPAMILVDNSKFHITVQVDEVDIVNIQSGQSVSMELDAFASRKLGGTVSKVAPSSTVDASGTTGYQVTIDFESTDAPLRAGMSATANITSNTRQSVLLVPNRAVQLDRQSGATFVELQLADGATQKVEVQLGLRDDQNSEVREGLADGDKVIVRHLSSRERLQQSLGSR